MLKSYRELKVWQELVTMIYEATRGFPKFEQYGLTQQLQRAAVSIPSNIAEGEGRGTTKEWTHHLAITRGSLYEVETQLLLAKNLNYLTSEQLDPILSKTDELSRMLRGLQKTLNRRK